MPDKVLEGLGVAGGSGILVALLSFLGIKQRIDRIDNDLQDHKKDVVYTDTFNATIDPLKDDISEIKNDIKTILSNSAKRRNGDI